jgi:hypothetical protein
VSTFRTAPPADNPRTCSQCPTIVCNKIASSSGSSINPGAIAGPVVAVLVIASCALFWWLRRKKVGPKALALALAFLLGCAPHL